jgi:hypothetical protein
VSYSLEYGNRKQAICTLSKSARQRPREVAVVPTLVSSMCAAARDHRRTRMNETATETAASIMGLGHPRRFGAWIFYRGR